MLNGFYIKMQHNLAVNGELGENKYMKILLARITDASIFYQLCTCRPNFLPTFICKLYQASSDMMESIYAYHFSSLITDL